MKIDDALRIRPELRQRRPEVGLAPKLSDAELVTLAVLQALLGFTSETRFLRHARAQLRPWFPYLPHQSGYNKRLRKAQDQLRAIIRLLAADTDCADDDTWVMDSTPVECGRSRPTALRSDLAGGASYCYCASHSRWFWGLRLHLVTTPTGLPITFALANPKVDEREVARDLFESEPGLLRPGQVILADKGYASAECRAVHLRERRHLGAPGHQTRTRPVDQPFAQAHAPNHRIGQRHPQDAARPRTSRGKNTWRCLHSGSPASLGPDRGHMAQLP